MWPSTYVAREDGRKTRRRCLAIGKRRNGAGSVAQAGRPAQSPLLLEVFEKERERQPGNGVHKGGAIDLYVAIVQKGVYLLCDLHPGRDEGRRCERGCACKKVRLSSALVPRGYSPPVSPHRSRR